MRWVYSRGRESGGPPTAYITVGRLPERVAAVRREGLAALTLAREMPTTASGAPWLLAGAKTLSYAVNMAALRYAAERGAGDVIFVSTDGYVLEGPRSTVVIATDDGLQTPPPSLPILHGTTQQALFDGCNRERAPLRVPAVAASGSACSARYLAGIEHYAGRPGAHAGRAAVAAGEIGRRVRRARRPRDRQRPVVNRAAAPDATIPPRSSRSPLQRRH